MSAGDCFRRAKRAWSEGVLRTGDRVRLLKGVFTAMEGSIIKGYGNGKWALKIDGLGDCLYLIVTDDFFEIALAPSEASPSEKP
jgi:hypothetical protein